MKKYKSLLLFATVSAALFASVVSADAGRASATGQAGGRLVVWRSPGLGRNVIVGVLVDGRRVADLTYGRHYDAVLPPGRHVVAVEAFPRVYAQALYTVQINVRPGEVYNFTAKGGANQLILK